jgi:hypothetical protein
MPHPSHSPWIDFPYIRRRVQITASPSILGPNIPLRGITRGEDHNSRFDSECIIFTVITERFRWTCQIQERHLCSSVTAVLERQHPPIWHGKAPPLVHVLQRAWQICHDLNLKTKDTRKVELRAVKIATETFVYLIYLFSTQWDLT